MAITSRPPEPDPPYPMNDRERESIIEAWMPRARNIALYMRMEGNGFEPEDWISEAYVSLVESVARWIPAEGCPFAAYVTKRIKWRLMGRLKWSYQGCRRIEQTPGYPGCDDYDGEDAGFVTTLEDLGAGDNAPVIDIDLSIMIRDAIARLPPFQRKVLTGTFYNEKTRDEIADDSGVSRSRIQAVLNRVLCDLANELFILGDDNDNDNNGYPFEPDLTDKDKAFVEAYIATGSSVKAAEIIWQDHYGGPLPSRNSLKAAAGRYLRKSTISLTFNSLGVTTRRALSKTERDPQTP